MGERDYYKDAKQTLSQIHCILETKPLTKQQRSEIEMQDWRESFILGSRYRGHAD
jgi:hypothetical protein